MIDMNIVNRAKIMAEQGTSDGTPKSSYYISFCKWHDLIASATMIFTRDIDMHLSGWWKNPDYNQCYHLSLSFRDRETGLPKQKDKLLTRMYAQAFFPNNTNWLWSEPPFTPNGKLQDVWHYRLFCNEQWQPTYPRGEVYTKKFTEKGWKSFSELQDKK